MKVTTKNSQGEVLYSRTLESDVTLNQVVQFLMTAVPKGDDFVTTVSNKGFELNFNNAEALDISVLVRKVEGIIVRAPRTAAPVE